MSLVAVAACAVASPHVAAQTFQSPAGLAISLSGALVVADRGAHRVLTVAPETGEIRVLAGIGSAGFAGDGGPAVAATFRNPEWVDFDAGGRLWIADRGNSRIRVVDPSTGWVRTVVGGESEPYTGDGGPAVDAGLTYPFGVLVGPDQGIYVFDTEAHAIRKVDRDGGIRLAHMDDSVAVLQDVLDQTLGRLRDHAATADPAMTGST